MQTREVLSIAPAGNGVVFTQELRADGSWYNRRARSATPEELMTNPTANTGSTTTHARKSPSSSERWSVCTASLALEAEHPDILVTQAADRVRKLTPYLESLPPEEVSEQERRAIKLAADLYNGKTYLGYLKPQDREDLLRSEGSVASRTGQRAHEFAEGLFHGRVTVDQIPEEFRIQVTDYVEHCLSLVPAGVDPLIEHSVPLYYAPGDKGTLDFGIITEERITIRDYKNGAGKLVYSIGNPQLALYALSLVREQQELGLYEFEPDTIIDIKAIQPNHHEAADLKPWILTLKDLEDFCKPIEEAARRIDSGEGLAFAPGDDTCTFCSMRAKCSARAQWLTEALDNPDAGYTGIDLLNELPDDGEIPDTKKKDFQAQPVAQRLISRLEYATNGRTSALSDEVMVALWNNGPAIKKLLDDIDEHLEARVLCGEKIEGLKVVQGNPGNRAWVDEKKVITFLRGQGLTQDDFMEKSLRGPAQIEKIPELAKKMKTTKRTQTTFEGLITRPEGRLKIAPADDKRPEARSNLDELPDAPDEVEVDDENVDMNEVLGL